MWSYTCSYVVQSDTQCSSTALHGSLLGSFFGGVFSVWFEGLDDGLKWKELGEELRYFGMFSVF